MLCVSKCGMATVYESVSGGQHGKLREVVSRA
jgi:hypothetical protein